MKKRPINLPPVGEVPRHGFQKCDMVMYASAAVLADRAGREPYCPNCNCSYCNAAAPSPAEPKPDRTGMVYYKRNECTAASADSPDCICWSPSEPRHAQQRSSLPTMESVAAARMRKEEVRIERIVGAIGEIHAAATQTVQTVQAAEPPVAPVQSAHWEDCWREHLPCAIAKIERMLVHYNETCAVVRAESPITAPAKRWKQVSGNEGSVEGLLNDGTLTP